MTRKPDHLADRACSSEFRKTTAALRAFVANRRPKPVYRVQAIGRHVAAAKAEVR